MIKAKLNVFILILFMGMALALSVQDAHAHARLISPAPRSNNAGIKSGPCGNLPRGLNPTVWTVGESVTLRWEEVIDHPGKYLFSLSLADDLGFEQNILSVQPDIQGGALPHQYQVALVVPNLPCENCTFQMIQSMEENPNNPSFYYSCADIRIVAAPVEEPPPEEEELPPVDEEDGGDGGQSTLSSHSPSRGKPPEMGGYGCGSINGASPPPGGSAGAVSASIALMLGLLLLYATIRQKSL